MFIFIGFTAGNGPPAERDLNQAEQSKIYCLKGREVCRDSERENYDTNQASTRLVECLYDMYIMV